MARGRPSYNRKTKNEYVSKSGFEDSTLRTRYLNFLGIPLVPVFAAVVAFSFLLYALSTNQSIFGTRYNLSDSESTVYAIVGGLIAGTLALLLMIFLGRS